MANRINVYYVTRDGLQRSLEYRRNLVGKETDKALLGITRAYICENEAGQAIRTTDDFSDTLIVSFYGNENYEDVIFQVLKDDEPLTVHHAILQAMGLSRV